MNNSLVLYLSVLSLIVFHESTVSIGSTSPPTEICHSQFKTPVSEDPYIWWCSCGPQAQSLPDEAASDYYYTRGKDYKDYCYQIDLHFDVSVQLCFNSSHNILENEDNEPNLIINFQERNVTGQYFFILVFYSLLNVNRPTNQNWNFTCTVITPPLSSTNSPTPLKTGTTIATASTDSYQQTNNKAWVTGVISGSVVGGVVFIIIIVSVTVTILMCRRRKTNTTRHIRTQLGSSANRGENQNPHDIDRSVASRENSSVNAGDPVVYNVVSRTNPMPVGESVDLNHDYETLRSMNLDYDNIGFSTETAHANSDSARSTSVTLIENQLYKT